MKTLKARQEKLAAGGGVEYFSWQVLALESTGGKLNK